MAAVFLVIGVLGLVVLLLSLFAGAAAASLLPGTLPDAVRALLALAVGVGVAVPLAWGAVRLSRALADMPTRPTLTRHHLSWGRRASPSPPVRDHGPA